MLDEKFVSLVEEAEKKDDKNHVVQANALKRKKWGNRREKKKAWRDTSGYDQKKKGFKELNKPIGQCLYLTVL